MSAEKERPQVPHLDQDNAVVLVATAKARQSEQGALKRGGIDLLVMPPKLKGRLPLWRACSVDRSAVRQNGGTYLTPYCS